MLRLVSELRLFSYRARGKARLAFPGHRHFLYLCANLSPPADPVATFKREVATHFYGSLKGPFNDADRERAGIKGWYENVQGRAYGMVEGMAGLKVS
jgi:hypothetical protein